MKYNTNIARFVEGTQSIPEVSRNVCDMPKTSDPACKVASAVFAMFCIRILFGLFSQFRLSFVLYEYILPLLFLVNFILASIPLFVLKQVILDSSL